MKSETSLTKSKFEPIELKLTFETRKEFEAFFTLIAYTNAQQKTDLVNKNIGVLKGASYYKIKELTPQDFIPMESILETLEKYE